MYQIAMKKRKKNLGIFPYPFDPYPPFACFIVFLSFLFLSPSVLLYLVYGAHARHEQILQIVQYQHSSSPELNWIDGGGPRPRWSGRRYLSKGFAAPRVPPTPWSNQQNWSVNKLTTLITTTTTTLISFKMFCRSHHHLLLPILRQGVLESPNLILLLSQASLCPTHLQIWSCLPTAIIQNPRWCL